MSISQNKLSTLQLVLLSTGGMIGAGWLFSPYYGFQTAGVGVLISWVITIAITFIIGLSFAEVACILPILGGVSRFIGVTHNRTLAFIFLSLSWLSYVVYLPLEAQSAIQYLGFWWNDLVRPGANGVELSGLGLAVAFAIIIGLTWFNTLFLKSVATANAWVSIWKLIIPISIALILIIWFGKWDNVVGHYAAHPVSVEKILLAITGSGLAFAFTGFQNSLVLANNAANKNKALPYSIFVPIIVGGAIYVCLSLAFITCLPSNKQFTFNAVAPLLGLVSLFGIHIMYVVLFVDAIIAPLGTANVYTAITGRVLYGLATDFLPKSILTKLNSYSAPYVALWTSALVGMCFLLPFPSWKDLVNFLSSVVVFAYISGPITLIILRKAAPEQIRSFKVTYHHLVGYLGFAFCSLLIYWSGLMNLAYLSLLLVIIVFGYGLVKMKFANKNLNHCEEHEAISSTNNRFRLINVFTDSWIIISYLLVLTFVSYLHSIKQIVFPIDNLAIIMVSLIFCKLLVSKCLTQQQIVENIRLIIPRQIESTDSVLTPLQKPQ
jgi:amino acid transporter